MTVRDVCDVAYVLLTEQLERLTSMEWQAAALRGSEELPQLRASLAEQRAAFDEMLASEPVVTVVDNSEQARMRRALGV